MIRAVVVLLSMMLRVGWVSFRYIEPGAVLEYQDDLLLEGVDMSKPGQSLALVRVRRVLVNFAFAISEVLELFERDISLTGDMNKEPGSIGGFD